MPVRTHCDAYYKHAWMLINAEKIKKGWTNEDLAAKSDLTGVTLSRYISGEQTLTDKSDVVLRNALGIGDEALQEHLRLNGVVYDRNNLKYVDSPVDTVASVASVGSERVTEVASTKKPPVVLVGIAAAVLVAAVLIAFAVGRAGKSTGSEVAAVAPSIATSIPSNNTTATKHDLQKRLAGVNVLLTAPDSPQSQRETMSNALVRDVTLKVFSETTFTILNGHRFKTPMHLDTVFGHYKRIINPSEKDPDNWHPGPEKAADENVLRQAFVQSWNESHPDSPTTSFDALLD